MCTCIYVCADSFIRSFPCLRPSLLRFAQSTPPPTQKYATINACNAEGDARQQLMTTMQQCNNQCNNQCRGRRPQAVRVGARPHLLPPRRSGCLPGCVVFLFLKDFFWGGGNLYTYLVSLFHNAYDTSCACAVMGGSLSLSAVPYPCPPIHQTHKLTLSTVAWGILSRTYILPYTCILIHQTYMTKFSPRLFSLAPISFPTLPLPTHYQTHTTHDKIQPTTTRAAPPRPWGRSAHTTRGSPR